MQRRLITPVVGLLTFAALTTITMLPGSAAEVVEIRLRGHYFSEPATVQITVAVEPDHDNRMLRVEADGDRLFRSTELNLSGEGDKRLHVIEFKNLPAGAYELRAQVLAGDAAVRGMATLAVVVSGIGGR